MGEWTGIVGGIAAVTVMTLLTMTFAHFVVFERRSVHAAVVVTLIVVFGVVASAVVAFGLGWQPLSIALSYGFFTAAGWYAKRRSTRLF